MMFSFQRRVVFFTANRTDTLLLKVQFEPKKLEEMQCLGFPSVSCVALLALILPCWSFVPLQSRHPPSFSFIRQRQHSKGLAATIQEQKNESPVLTLGDPKDDDDDEVDDGSLKEPKDDEDDDDDGEVEGNDAEIPALSLNGEPKDGDDKVDHNNETDHGDDHHNTITETIHNHLPKAVEQLENAISDWISPDEAEEDNNDDNDSWVTTDNSSAPVFLENLEETANAMIANMSETTEERKLFIQKEDVIRGIQDKFFGVVAVLPALLAWIAWDDISHSLSIFLGKYGAVGRAVDGGEFMVNLLRPTIAGVVVPVISIALATLVSTTVNVLRERQIELRVLINKEACELRLLRRAVLGMFGTRQHASRRAHALALLSGYVEQLERECNVGAVDALEELELTGGISVNELDKLSQMLHGVDGAAASRQGSVAMAGSLISNLNDHRSERVARLLSVFPAIHWATLLALTASVLLTYLFSSNQQVLQYLNSIQLRSLFAILVGVFSATATLCLILADPFRGSFSITEAATQLGDLRLVLKRDVLEACAEEGEISSKFVYRLLLSGSVTTTTRYLESTDIDSGVRVSRELRKSLLEGEAGDDAEDGTMQRPRFRRFGLISTVYFHILTGPLGSNARVLGDVIAWMASFVTRLTRSASHRYSRVSSSIRQRKFQWPWRKPSPDQAYEG